MPNTQRPNESAAISSDQIGLLVRVSGNHLFAWAFLLVLRALPNHALSATHAAVLRATIDPANRSVLESRTLVYVPQIAFALWIGAADFHRLRIPRKMLL